MGFHRKFSFCANTQKETHLPHGQISLIISSEARIQLQYVDNAASDTPNADYSLILV